MSQQREPGQHHRRIWAITERRPHRGVTLAARLLERAAKGPLEERAWAAYSSGFALLTWERLRPAHEQLDVALALFEQLQHLDGRLRCRRLLLTLDHLSGVGPRLQSEWSVLAADYEAAGDYHGAARVRMDQAAHLNVLARPDEALQLVAAASPQIETAGTPADRARLLRLAAVANTSAGRFAEAEQQVEAAISLYQSQHLVIDVAKCRMQRAWVSIRLERLEQAQDDLRGALATLQRYDLVLNTALCEHDLGLIDIRVGRFYAALAAMRRAQHYFRIVDRQDFVVRCDLHIGVISYYVGLYELAILCYRRAEVGYRRSGIGWGERVARRNQALALRAQGKAKAALGLLSSIEQAATDTSEWLELAEVKLEQAKAHYDLGQEELALTLLKQAESRFDELDNRAATAECRLEQAWIALSAHHYARAEALLHSARPVLTDRPAHHWRIDYGLARCAEERGAAYEALSYYRQASTTVATLRRQLASEHASSGIFAQARQLFDNALRHTLTLGDPVAVLELVEQQRAVALQGQMAGAAFAFHGADQSRTYEQARAHLQQQLEQPELPAEDDALLLEYLEQLLQARHYEQADEAKPLEALDLPDLRSRLAVAFPAGWTILVYTICGEELVTVALDERGAALDRRPLGGELRQLLGRATDPAYRRLLYLDAMRLVQQSVPHWRDLEALGRLLLPEAVRRSLHPERRLLILPAGMLHALPWAALRVDGAWLCERCVPQLLPSLGLWPILARRVAGNRLLFVGCSQFGGRAPKLRQVPMERELVAAAWPGPFDQLLDTEASTARVRALGETGALRDYRALHIASHAQLFAGRGLLAHLKLWESDLILDEVARLDLAGALVVLATCDGAASEALAGEELLSLGRAFLAAGASEVVASLWPTYDLATQELWGHFYQELGRGSNAATALTLVQRALARRYRPGMSATDPASPLVWGGFALLGAGTSSYG